MPLVLRMACLALLLASLFSTSITTEKGKQCPTAPVQQITVAIKSKCGCVVGYETRAPKPGEEGFLQCGCKEKKAAEHEGAVSRFALSIDATEPSSQRLALPLPLTETYSFIDCTPCFEDSPRIPQPRPPSFA